jgi:hypothetical protein
MTDTITNISKVALNSVFTIKKYDTSSTPILEEDIERIIFIRNFIEESVEYIRNNHKDIDTEEFARELKEFAIDLFIKMCNECRGDYEMNPEEQDFDDREYFNYVYHHLEYPA